jgi:flagellar basal body rod protein FlgG
MNYGLFLSAGGTLASLHRQDALANNLANLNTAGFKPDAVHFRARLPERLEAISSAALADPQFLLEQLGGGTLTEPTHINFRQGELAQTGNDLDVAIQGDGFFVVSDGLNAGDGNSIRFTRDGRFSRNAGGELIMASTGYRVLDQSNQPVVLNRSGPVRIDSNGTVYQGAQSVGTLQIATVADRRAIVKEGANLLRIAGGAKPQAAIGIVRQGHVESSGVDPILAMNQMINASKAVQANATMMQYHDHILGQAVNTLGRVA